jgi:PAS domain S-box-containing protein
MKKKIGVVGDREMLFSELRYRRLFETAQDGILLVDFETGMILDVNQFLIDLLGYSKNDFLGKHLWDVGALKDIAASKDNYYTLQKKRYVRFENLPLKTKTGKEVDVEFVSNAYRAGKEMIIQCNIRDITDRKKVQYLAQEDLRASEETLSSTLFATNIGSYRTDFVKGVWTSSEVLDGIFGIKKNYKRSIQNWLALVYPEDREMMKKYLEEEIFTNHKSFNKEYRIRRKTDGEMRWVLGLGKVDCDSNGRAIFMVGTIKDITDRKNAEEKLKISQERYSAIFDQSLIAIEFYDADGNLVSVNNVCLELFGVVDSAEVKGFKLFDDPNISKDIKDRLLNNETVRFDAEFSFEEVKKRRLYRTTCSGVKILNWLMTPLRSAGVTIGYILQIRDITVQKRAEEAIQREQLLTKAIIDSIPGAFYVLDEKGCYVRWNAYQRDEIVGKPEDQVLGTSAAGTIHPDDRALIQEKIVNVLVNGVDEIVEGRVLLRGGPEYRWLLMTGRRMILDGKPFLVGIGVDITENVNAERFIYEVKMRNEAILDSIGDAVFATDIDGKIILINKMAEEMICVNADKAIGNHYDKVIHFVRENDGKPSNDFIAAAIKDNKITSMANHTLLVRNDGSKISVADSAAPVKDIKGDISGCVVVFRDVTKDRQIDKAKNEFVSLTSHQLRTPTTAISWYSEALLADDASVLNTKQKSILQLFVKVISVWLIS